MIPTKHSFRLVSKKEIKKIYFFKKLKKQGSFSNKTVESQDQLLKLESEKDTSKRAFLKLAGLVGLGVFATTLIPKKAEALVFGSTPAASHVGVKDLNNLPISPATEGTLSDIKLNTDKLIFVGDSLKVINSGSSAINGIVGLQNTSAVPINPATEEGVANIGQSVNDQSIWMLRKIITLLKPLGMTTGGGSNRLSVDVVSGGTVTVGSGTVTTVGTLTNLSNIGNVNGFSLMKDSARNAYANSIRSKISF